MGGAHDEVEVGELLETALTLKGQDLKGVEITRDIGDLPIVRTDRYKLLQIIVNFVANAYDAVDREQLDCAAHRHSRAQPSWTGSRSRSRIRESA